MIYGSGSKRDIKGGVSRMLELSAIVDRAVPQAQVSVIECVWTKSEANQLREGCKLV